MGLFRTSLFVVLSCAVMSVQAGKMSVKLENLRHRGLSSVEKNPAELSFGTEDVFKLTLEHGGCGDDGNGFSDCKNDRQRIEFKSGYTSLKGFNGPKVVKRHYRTNLYLPDESALPNLSPMLLMIHQVKLLSKLNPVWKVNYQNGHLSIKSDAGEQCGIDKRFVPREEWIEIEILADYTPISDRDFSRAEPFFTYAINGTTHCKFFSPLITKRALQDAKRSEISFKYGIYNTYASKWLLAQPANQKWVKTNSIKFNSYQQDQKGLSNGAVSSNLGTPFDYDWPVKLPKQSLYYTDWQVADSREKLVVSRFERKDVSETNAPKAPSTMDFSASTSEICGRAIAEWKSTPGDWAKAAESRGLSAESCKLFLK